MPRLPADDYKHHQWLKPLRFQENSAAKASFDQLLEYQFVERFAGGRNQSQLTQLKRHFEVLLLNLSFVMYQRHWLLVPLDSSYYSQNYASKRMGIGYRGTSYVLECLYEGEYIHLLPGRKYRSQPVKTRIFPTPKLMKVLWRYLLEIEQPLEPLIFS